MDRPRLTTDDIAHLAEGNSPATVALDYDEACTAMAQELLAIRRGPGEVTTTELLPCPFCGGPANGIVLFKMGAVLCDDCGYAIDRNKAPEAIAAWNRRASQAAPAPSALVKALRTAEAALSDIGDAEREEGDDLAWCEGRAAKALPLIRPVLRAALITTPAPSDGLREALEAERERIAVALEAEADLLPCAEDAAVTRSNAALIRADFSYEDADRAALTPTPAEVEA